MSSHEFNYLSKKTPFSIFVDPDHFLGFIGNGINKLSGTKDDPDDPDGTLVQPYIDRLSKVASFYTYMADYGDARLIGGNYTTGWTGFIEHYARIPPDRRRNIMVNPQEYWTLGAIYSPNFYYTNINQQTVPGYGSDVLKYDPTNATGITLAEVDQYWRDGGGFDPIGEREITREFARQAAMGSVSCPHLFPSGAPEGGLTPGSPGATIGTFKSVAKRFWNDIAEYAKSRGTECIIQYSDFGANIKDFTTIPSIAMRTTNATGHSWWRGDFWNPPMQNRFNWAVDK